MWQVQAKWEQQLFHRPEGGESPAVYLCRKENSALTATHLKGPKSQCRDRYSME